MLSVSVVTEGMNGWLESERDSNATDVAIYKFLNDYDDIAAQIQFSPEDSRNLNAQKSFAHTQRFMRINPFWAWFESEPTNDEASAKILFAAMMRLSGSRRRLNYISAVDGSDFVKRRQINTQIPGPQVTSSIEKLGANVTLNDLRQLADSSIALGLEVEDELHHYGIGEKSRDNTLHIASELEIVLTDFAVGLITHSTNLRDGMIERVPVLEPKSISKNPAVIYPFVPGFWQNYTPSL